MSTNQRNMILDKKLLLYISVIFLIIKALKNQILFRFFFEFIIFESLTDIQNL